jgi:hypothetical protein
MGSFIDMPALEEIADDRDPHDRRADYPPVTLTEPIRTTAIRRSLDRIVVSGAIE